LFGTFRGAGCAGMMDTILNLGLNETTVKDHRAER
jgi:hypothetical protein